MYCGISRRGTLGGALKRHGPWSLEERLLDLAVKTKVTAATKLNEILGAGVLAVGLPLFLRTVLRETSDGSDVLNTALQVRSSKEAKRFRGFCQKLRAALDAEDLRAAMRGLNDYTAELTRVFGKSGRIDVIWNLVESGIGAAAAGMSLEAATKAKGPLTELAQWWKRRRFALIAKSLNQVGWARALRSDVKRVFGQELAEAEFEILATLQAGRFK